MALENTAPDNASPVDLQAGQQALAMPAPIRPVAAVSPAAAAPMPAPDVDSAAGASALSGSFGRNTVVQDAMINAGIVGIPKRPDGTPEPMGWAKSLVAGAQSAIAGAARPSGKASAVGSVIGNVLKGLGNSYDPNGAPGLLQGLQQGAHGTLAAQQAAKDRADKAAQQQLENADEKTKMQALQMHTNIEMAQEQRAAHMAGEKGAQDSVDYGKKTRDAIMSLPKPPDVIIPEITYADMLDKMHKGELTELQTKNALPIDRRPTGNVEKDGSPEMATYYTVLGVPEQQPMGDLAKDADKYLGYKYSPESTVPGELYNYLQQQVANKRAANNLVNKARTDADLEEEEQAFRSGPDYNAVMTNPAVNNDPMKAIEFIQSNPALNAKYKNAAQDLENAYGKDLFDKLIAAKKATADKTADALDKLAEDPVKLADPGTGAMLQGKIDDPNTDPKLLPQLRRMQGTAKAAGIAKTQAAASEAHAKQVVEDRGVIEGTAENLVDGLEDPTQMNKRDKDYDTKLQAAQTYSLQKYGKPWNMAQAQIDFHYANSVPVTNTLDYLVSVKPNMDQLVAQSNKFARTDFPAINNAEAWLKLQKGDPSIAAYHATVLEVADQVAKILSGGTGSATSDAKLRQAQELFNVGFSAPSIAAIANDVTPLLAHRATAMVSNNRYLSQKYPQFAGTPAPAPQEAAPGKAVVANPVSKKPQTVGHQIGDPIVQNGQTFKVTAVDKDGRVTGAQ